MGIRGFIRNTVEAIRRFFNGPDIEDDSGSTYYSDKAQAETEVEATATKDFFIDPAVDVVASELVASELVTSDWSDEEVAVGELVTSDWSDEEVAVGELVASDWSDEEVAAGDWSDEEVAVGELVASDWSDEEVVASELAAGDWLDEDRLDDSMSSGGWEKNGGGEEVIDEVIDEVVEPPPIVEVVPKAPRRRPVVAAIELDILNYPVDTASELDAHKLEHHGIEPQRQVIPAVFELDVLNYPVNTEDEMESYLNEMISSEDSTGYLLEDEEVIMQLPEPVKSLNFVEDDAESRQIQPTQDSERLEQEIEHVPFHIQSGGEQVTLTSALESLLFVAESPVDAAHLAKILTLPTEQITEGLQTLDHTYAVTCRGVRVQNHEDKFQLVTAPPAASIVEDFLSFNLSTKLSGPALEALAVVAYRQPVTRAQVEAVRGVDCASVLRSLIQLGLIEESGRLETLGRPILYSVTELFMQHFGLLKMSELPPLELKEEELLLSTIESPEL